MNEPWIDANDLIWQSNWDGHEVGFPDRGVVELWQWRDSDVLLYLDAETNEILSIMASDD